MERVVWGGFAEGLESMERPFGGRSFAVEGAVAAETAWLQV